MSLLLSVIIRESDFQTKDHIQKEGLNPQVRGQNAGGQNASENCMVGQNAGLFWAR